MGWPGAAIGLVVVADVLKRLAVVAEAVVVVVVMVVGEVIAELLLGVLLPVGFLCPGTGLLLLWEMVVAAVVMGAVAGIIVVAAAAVVVGEADSALASVGLVVGGGPAVAGATGLDGEVERVLLSLDDGSASLDACV